MRQKLPETYPGWTLEVIKMIDLALFEDYLYFFSYLSSIVNI